MLCNLELPYIWVTDTSAREHLYFIDNIETKADVVSYRGHLDDIEFFGPILDVIKLTLKRVSDKSIVSEYKGISYEKWPNVSQETAESLLKNAGIRFMSKGEIDKVNFVDDIPGNTKEVDEILRKQRIEKLHKCLSEYEKDNETLQKKKEILEVVFKEIESDIRECERRIEYNTREIGRIKRKLKSESI